MAVNSDRVAAPGECSNCLEFHTVPADHFVLVRSIELRITSSFRMAATRATFLGLPLAHKRSYSERIVGFRREATRAAMYNTALMCALPPQTERLPRSLPLSQLSGATPTRAAISFRFSRPSSGRLPSSETETTR